MVNDESLSGASLAELNRLLEEVRVDAEPKVLVRKEGETVGDIIRRMSTPTDLTLLGLLSVEEDEAENYAKSLIELTQEVGSSLIVHSLTGGEILQTS